MKENTENELVHLTQGFIYNGVGEHTKSRVITNKRQAMYNEQKHFTILLKDGAHGHAHTHKRNGLVGL